MVLVESKILLQLVDGLLFPLTLIKRLHEIESTFSNQMVLSLGGLNDIHNDIKV